jgi:MFS family permease
VFLAASLAYLVGTGIAGGVGLRVGRKRTSVVSVLVVSVGVVFLVWPGHRNSALESIPGLLCIGAGCGGCEAATNPILASIADKCFPHSEGTVFALADMCFAFGFAIGPLIIAAMYAEDVAIMCGVPPLPAYPPTRLHLSPSHAKSDIWVARVHCNAALVFSLPWLGRDDGGVLRLGI